MLDRAYTHLRLDQEKNEGEGDTLEVEVVKNKSIVKGIDYFAKRWNRDMNDVLIFFKKSLGTGGKLEKKNIVLFCNCDIETLKKMLMNYKTMYVICQICKSHHTILQNNRKKCLVCGNLQKDWKK